MIRTVRSPEYNYNFDTDNGMFARWGKDAKDDPIYSPLGPEILDMEISTICNGPGKPCEFCYKSNGPRGKYMSYEVFSKILESMPRTLTQIAFGIGDIDGNPDLFRIMAHCRERGVIPNITINGYGMGDEAYEALEKSAGAVAVSNYGKGICYGAVERLTDLGMKQVNIHQVLSRESYLQCLELIDDVQKDPRLAKLNAVLFLMLKPKGRARGQKGATWEQFKELTDIALAKGVSIGFDSCSAPSFLKATEDHPQAKKFQTLIEPCEAFLFSSYCNVDGEFFPCSFMEGEQGWVQGLSALEAKDFMEDIWNHPRMKTWRDTLTTSTSNCNCKLQSQCRKCPGFNVSLCSV